MLPARSNSLFSTPKLCKARVGYFESSTRCAQCNALSPSVAALFLPAAPPLARVSSTNRGRRSRTTTSPFSSARPQFSFTSSAAHDESAAAPSPPRSAVGSGPAWQRTRIFGLQRSEFTGFEGRGLTTLWRWLDARTSPSIARSNARV